IISYEYDEEERITKVTDTVNGTVSYTYDALGQLLTETLNGTVVNTMTYDNYGNIKTKNGKTYTYDSTWKDLLTSYNGQTITYDAQGNPTTYLGHSLTWEKGRQLKSFDSNTYTYNANGIRTSKTVNGVKHTYTLDGTKILRETWGDNTLIPLYDNEDSVCGILYNSVPYYFIKNLQGDVIAIVDKDAQIVAKYSYDAWGVCTITQDSVGIAAINPFRYRGYYFDEESELYYLQSRCYDAKLGRFINADGTDYLAVDDTILACNIICYCQNSPTQAADPNGHGPFLAIGIQFVITVGRLTIGLEALWSTKNWKFYLFGFVGGSRSFNIKSLTQTENALMEDIMYLIRSVGKFSISSFSIFKRLSIAVSFIAILGNKHASFPRDYCGWFTGLSLSIWHVTASGAYSFSNKIKIGSLGLGVTTSKAGASFGQTFYFQLTGNNALKNNLDALKSGIQNKLAFLKLFACFF
ncbi:MAG: RHS repeat-associated core domain-containing protein, partial [Clostridia bacterium]|nr:RHS repeat-associated core domain-containing protein [Clostridia bacterium]